MKPAIEAFHDPVTATISYVVHAGPGSHCAVIDSVLDYDPRSGRTSTHCADRVIQFVRDTGLSVQWLLETHAHADHLSAAPYLREHLGGAIGIGEHIRSVQKIFGPVFNFEPEFHPDGSQFDHLFVAGETLRVGALEATVMHVPGHTPADVAYLFDGAVFVGDTLFMPDVGTARCDFPGGDARMLYASIRRLLCLPGDTQLFMCHDYPPNGRAVCWQTTVTDQRERNIHMHDSVEEHAFVQMRNTRDATLGMPTLLIPSIQMNIRAGIAPPPEANGIHYLKTPLNVL
ncbi:MBL fold metallo-hydrolase [Paraburkholderia rhizosphaerae]|uniref:Glyoxylase-like metal-dependent hydrolase (Beta-lactamase superfamily II) n=1 Tax=Paraburkholderia rhizosphaerae TaxID=480658 RepID=A0A4R8M030_9BURK|nr:MBL fold metallo-hydrolase [Paraburkholderia rhizosphaerae]TDY54586.1 glyoxylase-like metal-dependent hydrolase (beta-lactamase superfamily II) [Paraburkholderia rhizosphaerae]